MSLVTVAAKQLGEIAKSDFAGTAAKIGKSVSTLYRWIDGSVMPPRASQDRMAEVLGIAVIGWTEWPEGEGPTRGGKSEKAAGQNDDPSPLQLWRDAHMWRLEIQKRASTASAVAAAFKAEQAALTLLGGDAARYSEMVRITAETLAAFPEALAAWRAASAEAGL